MFQEALSESEINNLIQKFETERKRIFEALNKKDIEDRDEKALEKELRVVENISSQLIKLRKLKK